MLFCSRLLDSVAYPVHLSLPRLQPTYTQHIVGPVMHVATACGIACGGKCIQPILPSSVKVSITNSRVSVVQVAPTAATALAPTRVA